MSDLVKITVYSDFERSSDNDPRRHFVETELWKETTIGELRQALSAKRIYPSGHPSMSLCDESTIYPTTFVAFYQEPVDPSKFERLVKDFAFKPRKSAQRV